MYLKFAENVDILVDIVKINLAEHHPNIKNLQKKKCS